MKTAIAQLIENSLNRDLTYWKLEVRHANSDQHKDFCRSHIKTITQLIKEAESLEPVNEQQIKDAYINGGFNVIKDQDGHSKYPTASDWYNETFEKP